MFDEDFDYEYGGREGIDYPADTVYQSHEEQLEEAWQEYCDYCDALEDEERDN